jgi:hypothetical protein
MRTSETPRRLRSVVSLALAFAWILILPQIATASVVVSNYLEGNVGRTTPGPQLFSYTEARTATFDTAMDFERGSFGDTQVDANGEVIQLVEATTGTWTSPVIDTTTSGSNVFGLFGTKATVPDSTSVTLQFARGETPALALDADFVGPDGTADTSFEIGEIPAPFDWDFSDQFVVARLTLATSKPGTSPTVEAFTLDYDLAEVGVSTSHLIEIDGPGQTDFLLRVWVEDPVLAGAAVTGHYVSSSSIEPTAEAKVVIGPETQVGVAARVVVQSSGNPVPTGPGAPHNVSVSTTDMSGSSLTVTWQAALAGNTILIPHEITMTFA